MDNPQSELRYQILNLLLPYDTLTAHRLVADIIVVWGYALFNKRIISDPREVAELFWSDINQLTYKGHKERKKDQGNILNLDRRRIVAREWAMKLAEMPFDQTMRTFTLAVHDDWLHSCDLSSIEGKWVDEEETILQCMKWWAVELGVF